MISLELCRTILIRFFIALVIISSLLTPQGYCQESEDSQVFISGFNAYQQKDYAGSIEKMSEVLQKYPDTPLRDMVLFWLSRAYFKIGNQQEAARFMSQFSKEYPDNPLKGTVEDELIALTTRYDKGEKLPGGPAPAITQADKPSVVQKAKIAKDKLAKDKEKAEQERLAKIKAEKEQIVAAKAKEAEAAQQAATKTENAVTDSKPPVKEPATTVQTGKTLTPDEKAREMQLAVAAAEAEAARLEAEKQEQQRLTKTTIEQEQAAAKAKEAQLATAAEAETARLAALKAEEERKATEQAELERLAKTKLEQEQAAAAKAKEEQLAATAAAAAAEATRLAAEKQEQERVAVQKAEEKRKEVERAELERLAKTKLEQEQAAAAKAKEEQLAATAAAAAEATRLATEKQEQERVAAQKTEEKRKEAERAELERIAAVKAEEERLAVAARKSEEIKAAEAARLAAAKQDQERIIAENAALEAEAARLAEAKKEQERLTAVQAEEQRLAKQQGEQEKTVASKVLMREKAIAQFKSIIEKYPHTTAATAAATKLQELGIAVAIAQKPGEPSENAQILRLEVAQYAGFEFNLLAAPQAHEVARRISIPFEVTNRGNGNDSFYIESGFPADFNTAFAAATTPEQAINQTPTLAPGETFKGVVNLAIPATSIDGLRITHPIKVASRSMGEATQSRELGLIASAPLLRAVLKTDKTQPLPGDKIVYRIALLNVGSTAARDITFRLNFPPQLEPVNYAESGFKLEMKAALVLDGLQINSGENKELTVTLQLKEESLAGQELLTRAEMINNPLKTTAAFISNASVVQPQHGIIVRTGSERLVVIPGQTIAIPFVVANTGNLREKFKITATVKGALESAIFLDINRDSIRQGNEPAITEIGPLEPKEEASVVMEIKTPKDAADAAAGNAQISFIPEGDASKSAVSAATLHYSRPVLMMAMSGRDGQLKPGEIASFDLSITNRGSNLARTVELLSAWPEQLELVAAEPANTSVSSGNVLWNFKEVGAGEKRTIRVSFRVKAGTGVGTNIQVKNILKYEDQLGNRY